MHIAGEFDLWICRTFFLHRLHVAGSLRMVPACDHQFRIREGLRHVLKCLNHQLQPLVGSPFAEGQDAMFRISSSGKIGEFGFAGQNAVRAEMHIIAAIFFVQNLAIPRHKYGYGIGQKKHSSGQSARQPVGSGIAHSGILQVHCVHQMVKGHVGVATIQARKQRSQKSGEGNEGIAAKGAEEQIEPHDIRLLFSDRR